MKTLESNMDEVGDSISSEGDAVDPLEAARSNFLAQMAEQQQGFETSQIQARHDFLSSTLFAGKPEDTPEAARLISALGVAYKHAFTITGEEAIAIVIDDLEELWHEQYRLAADSLERIEQAKAQYLQLLSSYLKAMLFEQRNISAQKDAIQMEAKIAARDLLETVLGKLDDKRQEHTKVIKNDRSVAAGYYPLTFWQLQGLDRGRSFRLIETAGKQVILALDNLIIHNAAGNFTLSPREIVVILEQAQTEMKSLAEKMLDQLLFQVRTRIANETGTAPEAADTNSVKADEASNQ